MVNDLERSLRHETEAFFAEVKLTITTSTSYSIPQYFFHPDSSLRINIHYVELLN